MHIPGPSHLVSWVCHKGTVPCVLCVSSGELISGCDPPGGCQASRISGRQVSSWEPADSLVEDVISGAEIVAARYLLALAVTSLPLYLPPGGEGLVCSQLACMHMRVGL